MHISFWFQSCTTVTYVLVQSFTMSITRILDDAANKNSKENQSKTTSWLQRLFSRKEVRFAAMPQSVFIIFLEINKIIVILMFADWQRKKPGPWQEPTFESTNLKSGNRIGHLSRIFVGSEKTKVHTQPPGVRSELTAPTMTQIESESEGIKETERKTPSSISTLLHQLLHDTVQQTLHNTVSQDTR